MNERFGDKVKAIFDKCRNWTSMVQSYLDIKRCFTSVDRTAVGSDSESN